MPRVCLRRSQTKAKRCLFTQLDVVEANLGEKGCVLRDDTSKGTDSKLYVYIYLRVCVYQREREREFVVSWMTLTVVDRSAGETRQSPWLRRVLYLRRENSTRIPRLALLLSRSRPAGSRSSFLDSMARRGHERNGSRDAEWPNRGGWTIAVARENDFQAFLSEPSLSFFLSLLILSDLELFFFLSFFFSCLREKDFSFFFFTSISFSFLFGIPGKSWKFCAREMIYLFLLILLIR